jgi:hypothetical protein
MRLGSHDCAPLFQQAVGHTGGPPNAYAAAATLVRKTSDDYGRAIREANVKVE